MQLSRGARPVAGEGGAGHGAPRTLLLVEDEPDLSAALRRFFQGRGWSVAAVGTARETRAARERADVVLLDLNLPDGGGLDLLLECRQIHPEAAIIVVTGETEISTAVEAMRNGAENFIPKPVDLGHLEAAVERAWEKVELRYRSHGGMTRQGAPAGWGAQASPAMMEVLRRVDLVAAAGDTTVLLLGETGVGKGWFAERIHALSPRAGRAFVETNCAGLSATFLDSELFGHEKGAFTDAKTQKSGLFEVAHRGTLFLDEIGDLARDLQPKLLKVLEKRSFRRLGGTREIHTDVRLVAATNRHLEAEVRAGQFREDLYYRLAVMPIRIPPLRERGAAAIAELANKVFTETGRDLKSPAARLAPETLGHLTRYPWPGNVRELKNVLERALILAGAAETLEPHHLPLEITRGGARTGAGPAELDLTLAEVERLHVQRVLERHQGNRVRAARSLAISRATLYEKLKRWGLHQGPQRPA